MMRNLPSVILILLCLAFFQLSFINVSVKEGFINGVEDKVRFEVNTDESPVYGLFDFDEELVLYARIYGGPNKLGEDIDLTENKVLKLQGRGKFIVELYTQKGKGKWKCSFYNSRAYRKLKKK